MNIVERTEALLALIEQHRLADRASVLEEASTAAARMVKEAHVLARGRVRKLMEEERARATLTLAAAQARSASRLRKLRQKQGAQSLELARAGLEEALRRLWTGAGRRQWLDHFASLALNLLPRGTWVVQHPEDWTSDDRSLLEERLLAQGIPAPQYVTDPAIRAGFRLCAGNAVLDATSEGLLTDRYGIDGRLIHYLGLGSYDNARGPAPSRSPNIADTALHGACVPASGER